MTQKNLRDPFIHELSDIHSAERQLTRALEQTNAKAARAGKAA